MFEQFRKHAKRGYPRLSVTLSAGLLQRVLESPALADKLLRLALGHAASVVVGRMSPSQKAQVPASCLVGLVGLVRRFVGV